MSKNVCPVCGCKRLIETICGGITQRVVWDDDFVVSEETFYEKTTKHSKYNCASCGLELFADDDVDVCVCGHSFDSHTSSDGGQSEHCEFCDCKEFSELIGEKK